MTDKFSDFSVTKMTDLILFIALDMTIRIVIMKVYVSKHPNFKSFTLVNNKNIKILAACQN